MKWDSGLPALLGFGFIFAFVDTAVERGSIGAAWQDLGEGLARWFWIAVAALAVWLVWQLLVRARRRP